MFFQSIYQMMSAGTDLNINIRRTDGKLSVAVMPRRTTLKDEAGQTIVPLILNGTPMELDGQFLQIITTPLQKAQGILTNLETFEQQARLAATQGKATGTAKDKKTKEAREKQEKMEKLLKRAEEAFTAGRYSEATTCFRQAKVLADTDRQKQIEARIQEVQKESSQGCLFPETDTQPLPQQPPATGTTTGAPTADSTAAARTTILSGNTATTANVRRILPESRKRQSATNSGTAPNVLPSARRTVPTDTTMATAATRSSAAAGNRHTDSPGKYGQGIPVTATTGHRSDHF